MLERIAAANTMIETFASVGAHAFDLTITNIDGQKVSFRRAVPLVGMQRILQYQLASADKNCNNIVIRPIAHASSFVQCDDIHEQRLMAVRDTALLGICTSPGNYQAWFVLPIEDFEVATARRLRKHLEADISASGATRLAGSYNFKQKYDPSFPMVATTYMNVGRTTTKRELEQRQLLGSSSQYDARSANRSNSFRRPKRWPDYQRCIDGAPTNSDGSGPDVSRADWVWCMTAASWGWPENEIAQQLKLLSSKARENGERYVALTASKATKAALH